MNTNYESNNTSKWLRNCSKGFCLAIFLLAGLSTNAAVTPSFTVISPANAQMQTGQTYGEWSVAWWRYILELPLENQPGLDPTGANCNYAQSGAVFFLVSTPGGNAVRNECVVPAGKYLFFALLGNSQVKAITDHYPEVSMRASIQGFNNSAKNLQANIDGEDISLSLNPKSTPLRTRSPDGFFTVTAPENNIFGGIPGETYYGVSDGFYLMVAPLSPGAHTITFGGNTRNFSSYVTYNLVVAP